MSTNLQGKKILIFQQRNWGRGIGHFLAKKLQAEGCQLAALTYKKSTLQFIQTQKEVKYDLIINDDEALANPMIYLAGQDYPLEEICRELGVDSVWPLVQSMRILVKSYSDKYYYGFKQNMPDEWIVAYIKAVYKYVKEVFSVFQPDLIISPNFAALPHLFFDLYGKKRGVPMLAITDTKVKGIFAFIYGYRHDQGPFLERIDELNGGGRKSDNLGKARNYIESFRKEFQHPAYFVAPQDKKSGWKKSLRELLSVFYHILRWPFRGEKQSQMKGLGPTPDYRPPRIIFRDYLSRRKNKRFMDSYAYYPFKEARKLIYFPLQFQPEEVIDTVAPYFNNQIETARQVAMSLPGDYTLVVKEHPDMVGLRPVSYIEKISRTPNVKLVDYRIPSDEILKSCDLVISPGGTVLAEAAFYRKPAIQLGNFGITLKLPNVFYHAEPASLSKRISEVLKINFENDEYERKLENYVAAAFDEGFDFNYYRAWERGDLTGIEKLWQLYRREIMRVFSKNAKVS